MREQLLSDELQAEIKQRVKGGPWHSADEFVRQSIKAADALRDLQAAIAQGSAAIARGESSDGEAFFDELEGELRPDSKRGSEE